MSFLLLFLLLLHKPVTFDQFKMCNHLSFCSKTEYWALLLKEKQMRNTKDEKYVAILFFTKFYSNY